MATWKKIAKSAEARAEIYRQRLEQLDSNVELIVREFRTIGHVGCDGVIMIPVDKYNRIIAILNSTIKDS
jgi:hypothetical protein